LSGRPLLDQTLARGLEALRQARWQEALELGRIALEQAPDHPDARHLRGLALLQSGDAEGAVAELERAAARKRKDAQLLGHLAQSYAACGRHGQAHAAFRRAERLLPGHWPYRLGAAIALAQQGRPAEAEALLRRLNEQHPGQALILFNLGNAQLALGRQADAERSLRAALQLDAEDAGARLSLGTALHRQLRYAEAIAQYRECIDRHPDWPLPRLNLVSALIDDGRFEAAIGECLALIAVSPQLPEAHRFLGAALSHQGRLFEALEAYAACARLIPEDAASVRSLGGALADCGRLQAAWRRLAQAEALEPGHPATRQLRGTVALAAGMFAEGWSAYRARPTFAPLAQKWLHPRTVQTLPESLAGLHVLVRREQGLGDELFFLRHLPRLRSRGAKVSVCASRVLQAMIARSGAADAVLAEDAAAPEDIDAQLFCGDLAYALNPGACSTLPPRAPVPAPLRDYAAAIRVFAPAPAASLRIPALDTAMSGMRQRLHAAGDPPYLALTWRAGTAARDQGGGGWLLSKQVDPAALAAALRDYRGTVLAVQRDPAAGELEALAQGSGHPIADFTDLNAALEDMLALLYLVDDYVGVSNTNMHLRAATGLGAKVLVPNPAEWRWMQGGRESPWFPGFRLYRQGGDGRWENALQALARDLAAH
jgi:tetratricopeptide (TPR) repeat protein